MCRNLPGAPPSTTPMIPSTVIPLFPQRLIRSDSVLSASRREMVAPGVDCSVLSDWPRSGPQSLFMNSALSQKNNELSHSRENVLSLPLQKYGLIGTNFAVLVEFTVPTAPAEGLVLGIGPSCLFTRLRFPKPEPFPPTSAIPLETWLRQWVVLSQWWPGSIPSKFEVCYPRLHCCLITVFSPPVRQAGG